MTTIKRDLKKDLTPSVMKDIERQFTQNKTDLANVVETLLNEKWKRRKTRLRARAVAKLSVLDTLAQIWDIEFLKYFIEGYTEYLTSQDGAGRQEIVDITKFTIDRENQARTETLELLGRR